MKRLHAILGTIRRWSAGMRSSMILLASVCVWLDALLQWPELNGGCGSYSMANCIASARSRPAISPASQSARSIPADTPADVATLPDRTMRSSGCGLAPMIVSTPSFHQCVVADNPFKIPAAPRINAPVQTEVVQVVVSWSGLIPGSGCQPVLRLWSAGRRCAR